MSILLLYVYCLCTLIYSSQKWIERYPIIPLYKIWRPISYVYDWTILWFVLRYVSWLKKIYVLFIKTKNRTHDSIVSNNCSSRPETTSLLKRLRNINLNVDTQFKHVSRHPSFSTPKHGMKQGKKTDYCNVVSDLL